MKRCAALLLMALAPAAAASAELPDGDLAAVRRAVAGDAEPEASPPPGEEQRDSPGWLRLQVLDKATGERPVSLSVPLALLDACVEESERGERPSALRELLDALGTARSLVEIDAEDSQVRIWIE